MASGGMDEEGLSVVCSRVVCEKEHFEHANAYFAACGSRPNKLDRTKLPFDAYQPCIKNMTHAVRCFWFNTLQSLYVFPIVLNSCQTMSYVLTHVFSLTLTLTQHPWSIALKTMIKTDKK